MVNIRSVIDEMLLYVVAVVVIVVVAVVDDDDDDVVFVLSQIPSIKVWSISGQ